VRIGQQIRETTSSFTISIGTRTGATNKGLA
jgi:hypothetical protein